MVEIGAAVERACFGRFIMGRQGRTCRLLIGAPGWRHSGHSPVRTADKICPPATDRPPRRAGGQAEGESGPTPALAEAGASREPDAGESAQAQPGPQAGLAKGAPRLGHAEAQSADSPTVTTELPGGTWPRHNIAATGSAPIEPDQARSRATKSGATGQAPRRSAGSFAVSASPWDRSAVLRPMSRSCGNRARANGIGNQRLATR